MQQLQPRSAVSLKPVRGVDVLKVRDGKVPKKLVYVRCRRYCRCPGYP